MTIYPLWVHYEFVPIVGTKKYLEVYMKAESETKDVVYVKVRIERGLHEKLKQIAQKEKRSMNFMLNNSVELLVSVKSREF